MTQRLRPIALFASAALVIGVLENALFGSDTKGTAKHDISVGFFFLFVAALACLLVVGATAIVQYVSARRA